MQKISVTVSVPSKDSCIDITPLATKVCDFYRGKSCVLFNKVILNKQRCPECLEKSRLGDMDFADRPTVDETETGGNTKTKGRRINVAHSLAD